MDDSDDMPRSSRHHHKKNKAKPIAILAGIIVIVIIIGLALYYFGGSATNVGSGTTAKITTSSSLFVIGGKEYAIRTVSYSATLNQLNVYITQIPIFVEPTLNVTLPINTSVKVSYAGTFADMQLKLISANQSSATIQIMPLAQALQVTPDLQYSTQVSYNILGTVIGHPTAQSNQTSSGNSTTTVAQNKTTTSATTTVMQNETMVAISSILQNDLYYGLAINYSAIYTQSTSCTPTLYNSTFVTQNGHQPSGVFSYQNVSTEVPYDLVQSTKSVGNGNYTVNFTALTKDPVFNNSIALAITLNLTTRTIKSDVVSGIFEGSSYSDLVTNYQSLKAIGNDCAALIG